MRVVWLACTTAGIQNIIMLLALTVFSFLPNRNASPSNFWKQIYHNVGCVPANKPLIISCFWRTLTVLLPRTLCQTRVPKNTYPVQTEHTAITTHSVQLLVFCTAHACLPSMSRLVSWRLSPKFHPLHTCINKSMYSCRTIDKNWKSVLKHSLKHTNGTTAASYIQCLA